VLVDALRNPAALHCNGLLQTAFDSASGEHVTQTTLSLIELSRGRKFGAELKAVCNIRPELDVKVCELAISRGEA
jgi:hypothetical protein